LQTGKSEYKEKILLIFYRN
jgi:hypothetical protein